MKNKVKILSAITAISLTSQGFCSMNCADINAAESSEKVNTVYVTQDNNIISSAGYTIESVLSSKLLTVNSDGNVHQWEKMNDTSQQWKIINLSDDYCKIVSVKNPRKALTVENGNENDGNNIYVDDYKGGTNQQFKIQKDGTVYYITTRCSDNTRSLDVYDISKENGANICQWKYWEGDGQKFRINPLNNKYTMLKGDLNFDGVLDIYDMILMREGFKKGFDDISAISADVDNNGTFEKADLKLLSDFLMGAVDSFPQSYYDYVKPTPPVSENGRKMEYLDRGVVAVSTGKSAFISWRFLATDEDGIGFNVYRTTDGKTVKLNDKPLYDGTNYTDTKADLSKNNTYSVKAVSSGKEISTDGDYTLNKNSTANCITVPIKAGGTIHFVWVGDFNGDGAYDYLVDRCTDNHQKLEAYLNDGTYLWTVDMGYNSENKNNISPGASTIDVGMWDGATVYDMDCDGYADVLLRVADGVVFGDGKKFSHKYQAIAVIDGRTGKLKASADIPTDYKNVGPMACMMEVGYLNGKTPSVVCWMKNRNKDKTFNSLTVAFGYENGKFVQQWKYDNAIIFDDRHEYKNGYAEAHQIRVADVDYDGKDEVLHMGYCLNGNGTLRYHMDKVVHGDRWYVGSFANGNNGKEMMGYGIQQENASGLLEYFYNASTGKILWTNYAPEGTYDVARGNVGDIDPNHDGFECWSFQGTFNQSGKKITDKYLYPVIKLWWDGDLLSESYNDGKIEKWDYKNKATNRLVSTWKVTDCTGSDRGAPMFFGDILGDWREEVIMTSSDYSKLIIHTTAASTNERIYCLAQNPCYRNCMTAKGYYQSHMLDYYLGTGMEEPKKPDVSIIEK